MEAKDQNKNERAKVEQFLDGIDEQQDRDAQEQANAALDFLKDKHQQVGNHNGNGQGSSQVDGHIGQHFPSRGGLLVAEKQIERHDAENVREGALVHHEFSGGGRKPANTWNDDGAAHDGQRDAVDHRIEPRHGQHGVQERGDGKRARHQSEKGKRGASQNERELVAPQLQFQRRFKDDEDEAHRAKQFQNESFKRIFSVKTIFGTIKTILNSDTMS